MIRAGWATVNITPPLGVPLAGYYVSEGRTEAARDTLDELNAKALVLEGRGLTVALITSDLIGIPDSLLARARPLISETTGIPEECLVLSASHNHSGPVIDVLPDEPNLFPAAADSEYIAVLARKLAGVVRMAKARTSPVRFGVGCGACDINVNRREMNAEGEFKPLPFLGRNRDAPVDRTVTVLRFEKLTGEYALLVNYSCHAVVLGPNLEISADYPGAMQRFVEATLGAGCTTLFTNGAEGDVNPIIHPGTAADALRLGRRLGAEVIKVADAISLSDIGMLRFARRTISLPMRREPTLDEESEHLQRLAEESRELRRQGQAGILPGEIDHSVMMMRHLRRTAGRSVAPAEISAVRVGDTVLCSVPGELFDELGGEIREAVSGGQVVIVGLANGHLGYLPTRTAYRLGGFEVEATALAAEAGEILRDEVIVLARSLLSEQ